MGKPPQNHLRASAGKRHRTYLTVEAHWRPDAWDQYRWHRADDTHLRASAGRRHRTYWTVEAHWRHSAYGWRRIYWAVEAHWRSGA